MSENPYVSWPFCLTVVISVKVHFYLKVSKNCDFGLVGKLIAFGENFRETITFRCSEDPHLGQINLVHKTSGKLVIPSKYLL